jgi:hypothetical protein
MLAPLLVDAVGGADLMDISERKFQELRHTPDFPKAVVLSARCVRWKVQELAAYVEKLPTVGPQSEPAQLQRWRSATVDAPYALTSKPSKAAT